MATAAEAPLEIQLLGGFRVSVDGRAVPADAWRLRSAKHLVKLLALAPQHRLHRELVLEQLWPGAEPEAAANRLHQTLYVARRNLEPDEPRPIRFLQFDRDERLVLSPRAPVGVDVEAFELAAKVARHRPDRSTYQAAIDLYTGELLPEDRGVSDESLQPMARPH